MGSVLQCCVTAMQPLSQAEVTAQRTNYGGLSQVADVWDGSTEEAKAEWQAKIDDADILVLDELAITYLGDKIKGKRLIALQRDAAASMRTCDAGEA